ncbi:MAG: acyltransferase [bacterium]|nr:acyltransferase [bacterium]
MQPVETADRIGELKRMFRGRPLSTLDSGGRDNNYNLLRMAAAVAVIVTHSYALSGRSASEPLRAAYPDQELTIARLGVMVFFVISGYLVTKSFVSRGSVAQFVEARVLRIYPALIAAVLVSLAIGAWASPLPLESFLAHKQVTRYFLVNTTMLHYQVEFFLPEVFWDLPNRIVNGSLWTLPSEVRMYVFVGLLGVLGLLKTRLLFLMALLGLGGLCLSNPALASRLVGTTYLAVYFAAGAFCFLFRTALPISTPLMALFSLLAIAASGTPFFRPGVHIAVVYGTFWFAYVPGGILRSYNRIGDYSYGTYIYAWPVQQLILTNSPGVTPLPLAAFATLATLPFAIASWHLLEHPVLRLKGRTWISRMAGTRGRLMAMILARKNR